MKKYVFICFGTLFLFASIDANAQQYKSAIGGRFGASNGITFKTYFTNRHAIDAILNLRSTKSYSTFVLTGLYEVHAPITSFPNVDGLSWYYGAGGSIGSHKDKATDEGDFKFNIDGALGLDYKFTDAPINISLDWKPAIDLTPDTGFEGEGLGMSLRYTF
jgi:hypothetical protein